MPPGWSNQCETLSFFTEDGKQLPSQILITKPEVLHAEENAIVKLAKSNESGEGATAFITHSPCLSCAKLLYSSGIIGVYYTHPYRNTAGVNFLKECKIGIDKL